MNKQIENIIVETLTWFDNVKREDENITVLKHEAPEPLRNSIYNAHGDRFPDDWIYDKYHSILNALTSYTIENADDMEEKRAEIVDGLVDVYTSDLTAWLNSHNSNVYYLTRAQEEYGAQTDGFKLLMSAQYMAIDEIYEEVVSYLKAEAGKEEEEK